ncbi:MAG: septum formation initiator family protein [Actinomycetaceae bacterium]|nr:septum formation initiator family protein [Actinomycetaceae bacterium]
MRPPRTPRSMKKTTPSSASQAGDTHQKKERAASENITKNPRSSSSRKRSNAPSQRGKVIKEKEPSQPSQPTRIKKEHVNARSRTTSNTASQKERELRKTRTSGAIRQPDNIRNISDAQTHSSHTSVDPFTVLHNFINRWKPGYNIMVQHEEKKRFFSLPVIFILSTLVISAVFFVPTLSQYLQQQSQLRETQNELVQEKEHYASLQEERELWNDDNYVKEQARNRLGYVMNGQTLYIVTDSEEGSAAQKLAEETQRIHDIRRAATPWYVTAWDSITMVSENSGNDIIDNPNAIPYLEAEKESEHIDETPGEKTSSSTK